MSEVVRKFGKYQVLSANLYMITLFQTKSNHINFGSVTVIVYILYKVQKLQIISMAKDKSASKKFDFPLYFDFQFRFFLDPCLDTVPFLQILLCKILFLAENILKFFYRIRSNQGRSSSNQLPKYIITSTPDLHSNNNG